jgi:hypothetical protein
MTQTSKTYQPAAGDVVTIVPNSDVEFIVEALDTLYGEMVYVSPVLGEKPAQWVFLTNVRRVAEQEDATE